MFKLNPRARLHIDFRQMFDKEEKNFDALIVATPDHWHSHLVLAGLAMNKHIYCAKPITRTVAEARRIKAACLASEVTSKASIQDSSEVVPQYLSLRILAALVEFRHGQPG